MKLPVSSFEEFMSSQNDYKIIKRCKDTLIIKLSNGEILKVLKDDLIYMLYNTGYSLEERLREVDNFSEFNTFAMPNFCYRSNGTINSYKMSYIPGCDFTDYYENVFDLYSYANIHSQIESNIRKGNELGIIFPDLCTTENIRITPDDKVYFIDYDGLQIKQMPAVGYSDFLGSPFDVLTPKYFDRNTNLFTPQIDIKSAIFLYFVDTFGINLSRVGLINTATLQTVSLDYLFSLIHLDDSRVQEKVALLFDQDKPNEFLGDDLYYLAEKYRLVVDSPNDPIKKLQRK